MNPPAFEFLNRAERYNRSKQIEALQLLSKAQVVRCSQPNLLHKMVRCLGGLLTAPGQRQEEWNVSPDRQPSGQAQ